jgi:hypothetical protein
MIGREYFVRQAQTLLRMAKSVRDPTVSASILSKAADLEAKAAGVDDNAPPRLVTPAVQDQKT